MPSFPKLHTGSIAKYPLTRGSRFRSVIYYHSDLSEQRFSKGQGGLASFILVFNDVSTTDKDTVKAFFVARLGPFDSSWDLVLPDPTDVTYSNMQFSKGQKFEATNTHHDRWQFSLKVEQTRI